jgi:hypothetical protein
MSDEAFREARAEYVHAQAAELLGHLPEDEIGDDERLAFKFSADGDFLLTTEHAVYRLELGIVWRLRKVPEGEEMSSWKDRRQLRRAIIPPSAGGTKGFN